MDIHNEDDKKSPATADPAPANPDTADQPSQVLLHVPVNVRSMSLVVLAVLAVLATLRWAAPFFIPLMLGIMFSYALSPVVDAVERWRIPRALSAARCPLGIQRSTRAPDQHRSAPVRRDDSGPAQHEAHRAAGRPR